MLNICPDPRSMFIGQVFLFDRVLIVCNRGGSVIKGKAGRFLRRLQKEWPKHTQIKTIRINKVFVVVFFVLAAACNTCMSLTSLDASV